MTFVELIDSPFCKVVGQVIPVYSLGFCVGLAIRKVCRPAVWCWRRSVQKASRVVGEYF